MVALATTEQFVLWLNAWEDFKGDQVIDISYSGVSWFGVDGK